MYQSTIAAISSDGEIMMKPTDFHHDQPTLNLLVSTLQDFQDDIKMVMEATGHYRKPTLKIFLESKFFVSVVNPYVIKKYSENDICKGKTDKKDAMRIAWYVLEKHYSIVPYNVAEQKYNDLKYLSRQYRQCVSMRVKARVQFYNLLDNIMPGIQTIINSRTADPDDNFLYKFVKKYESYDKNKSMSESHFICSYLKLAHKSGTR